MSPIDQPVVPKGSTMLVTAANGFLGSNIADQFLKLGYKVRGTTRDVEKNAWVSKLFDAKYGPGNFELVLVPEMKAEGAYDEAVKGVSAVCHTATNFTFSPDPNEVIPDSIKGTLNAMEAAAKEPTVKRFVLCSSSYSAIFPKPNLYVKVDADTWNEESIATVSDAKPPYPPELAFPVYAASKALSEKEAWKFAAEKKPGFVLNTVLPTAIFGGSLDPVGQGYASSSSRIVDLFKGDKGPVAQLPAQYFVDVQDAALLHVAAAIHPDIQSERVFAFAEAANGNAIVGALRKLYPDRTFPPDFQSDEDLSEIVPSKRAAALLRDMGQDGFTSLEECMRRNTKDVAA
ncbi:aldehyde reductase [Xylaria arbuscula]|nr:aldehyde reductase [Xylaria arbuscula]